MKNELSSNPLPWPAPAASTAEPELGLPAPSVKLADPLAFDTILQDLVNIVQGEIATDEQNDQGLCKLVEARRGKASAKKRHHISVKGATADGADNDSSRSCSGTPLPLGLTSSPLLLIPPCFVPSDLKPQPEPIHGAGTMLPISGGQSKGDDWNGEVTSSSLPEDEATVVVPLLNTHSSEPSWLSLTSVAITAGEASTLPTPGLKVSPGLDALVPGAEVSARGDESPPMQLGAVPAVSTAVLSVKEPPSQGGGMSERSTDAKTIIGPAKFDERHAVEIGGIQRPEQSVSIEKADVSHPERVEGGLKHSDRNLAFELKIPSVQTPTRPPENAPVFHLEHSRTPTPVLKTDQAGRNEAPVSIMPVTHSGQPDAIRTPANSPRRTDDLIVGAHIAQIAPSEPHARITTDNSGGFAQQDDRQRSGSTDQNDRKPGKLAKDTSLTTAAGVSPLVPEGHSIGAVERTRSGPIAPAHTVVMDARPSNEVQQADSGAVRPDPMEVVSLAMPDGSPSPSPVRKTEVNELNLRIEPPGLRDIEVRLTDKAGQIHLDVHAEDVHTRTLLRNGLEDLVSRLELRGLKPENVLVIPEKVAPDPQGESMQATVAGNLLGDATSRDRQQQHQQRQEHLEWLRKDDSGNQRSDDEGWMEWMERIGWQTQSHQ